VCWYGLRSSANTVVSTGTLLPLPSWYMYSAPDFRFMISISHHVNNTTSPCDI
jgi:hypothetical protein